MQYFRIFIFNVNKREKSISTTNFKAHIWSFKKNNSAQFELGKNFEGNVCNVLSPSFAQQYCRFNKSSNGRRRTIGLVPDQPLWMSQTD